MTLEDIYAASPSLKKVDDFITNGNLHERTWILSLLPKKSVGAEIGVFTGLFSEQILKIVEPTKLSLVDIWSAHGEYYGDWGEYTDFGRLKSGDALEATRLRTQRFGTGVVDLIEGDGIKWLSQLEDNSLDWLYLDTTHKYDQTLAELKAAAPKLKTDGMIIGDDWYSDIENVHAGVMLAVNDFIRGTNFDLRVAGRAHQWMLQRRPSTFPINPYRPIGE